MTSVSDEESFTSEADFRYHELRVGSLLARKKEIGVLKK